MCGIAGFIESAGLNQTRAASIAKAMGDSIAHRGPDDSGVWMEPETGTVLVHRRLAIIDLSPRGHQPMTSVSGRYTIVYNGEIYNHLELREQLDVDGWPAEWKGTSDTETLLACIEHYGLQKALSACVGMFALALHDRREKCVWLARDRIGEKPLYYGTQGKVSFFASELKAICEHPDFVGEVDRDALCLFLRHNYVPAPYSIFKDICKLPPGTFLKLDGVSEPTAYWTLDTATAISDKRYATNDEDVLSRLEEVLGTAISLQMQADVPLGAFLSGGIDSSLIVALMQERSSRKVQTFSVGFEDPNFDEAPYARAVAEHLETEHTELYVSPKQALDVIPMLPHIYDEPFSDSSQIPTHLVSRVARTQVTVSLSGDAGDELFGGYNRYTLGLSIWNKLQMVPSGLRNGLAEALAAIPADMLNRLLGPAMQVMPQRYRHANPGDKINKAAGILGAANPMDLYVQLISHWKSPAQVVIDGVEPPIIRSLMARQSSQLELPERFMNLDLHSYLPDDILVKVDRAAMATSLETRVPFLDHRVVELAAQLPMSFKIRDGVSKWCLRQLLYKRVPRELIERPKTGFGVPLASWLRGPLREWAEDLLCERRLRDAGYFDPAPIRAKWDEHLSGRRNWHYYIWDILMFESWRDRFKV